MTRHYEFPHVVELVRHDSGHLPGRDRLDAEERRPSAPRVDANPPRVDAATA